MPASVVRAARKNARRAQHLNNGLLLNIFQVLNTVFVMIQIEFQDSFYFVPTAY